ncbi:uncharacterized protein PV07_01782 [Cladophialophora immunda]|uniref:Ketoreductase (KR) domain-containing protein n=1 Tax=Cladophialophora immunda TaxID=569365 RepID=A0A0D2DH32_9EURO|nr:uncharacterized protein PV07_01782 [Cladophialophora immunda]KIW35059.1 hypothetical protein PV07_01782 [Cladophialophora immunda]OQV03203.1 hypothetical protein CLAIMM_08278 [Cladophialophora immunda]
MAPRLTWTPDSLPSLEGRTYVVTGGNAGIGRWTVHHLALHGATVYMTSRSAEKGAAAISAITAAIQTTHPAETADGVAARIHLVVMDLMSLRSVVAGARRIRAECAQLHGLVNSAGIMATPYLRSEDGYEAQWQTNYLAHWVLTQHLAPLLEATARTAPEGCVRVVNVSSMGHAATFKDGIRFDDTGLQGAFTFRRYAQSKLANILHANALHARYNTKASSSLPPSSAPAPRHTPESDSTTTEPTNADADATAPAPHIWAISLHPGNIDTQLNARAWGGSTLAPLLRCMGVYLTPEQGSYNSLWAVAGAEVTRAMSGGYFVPVGERKAPSKLAQDRPDGELARRLWDWTEREMRAKGFLDGV